MASDESNLFDFQSEAFSNYSLCFRLRMEERMWGPEGEDIGSKHCCGVEDVRGRETCEIPVPLLASRMWAAEPPSGACGLRDAGHICALGSFCQRPGDWQGP